MVNDLELVDSFKKLQEKPIYLYGAGIYGRQVISLLEECHIKIEGVVDSNPELQGMKICEINICSPEELLSEADNKDIIVIITTMSHTNQVVEWLESNISQLTIYTLFGLFYSIYFNLALLPCQEAVKDKIALFFKIWIYKKELM